MKTKKILGVIPARYDSSRLPGKALIDIGGKTMVQRVYERASLSQKLDQVIVATDDQRIYEHLLAIGGQVMMTSPNHQTGTDRCAEVAAAKGLDFEVIINIQGDEPFIAPEQIDELAVLFDDPSTEIATLAKKIDSYEELIDEKEAKVVLNDHSEALYMSRSPIPYLRGVAMAHWHEQRDFYKHIGIYGFRSKILANIPKLPQAQAELAEGLEQLRWLAHYKIKVGITLHETFAIDTAEDLKQVKKYL
ncbi:MAG: 3-deoxy-manno-octulosonate cytidylyltransferase [Microscillaceae bacterium]|nr:3-deoxy-manno-octulosonate cytidylyltransferase [Microscillaceae bacterium]